MHVVALPKAPRPALDEADLRVHELEARLPDEAAVAEDPDTRVSGGLSEGNHAGGGDDDEGRQTDAGVS